MTHLEGANLWDAHLDGADLRNAFFDVATILKGIVLGSREDNFVKVADLHWESANLALVNWAQMRMLGDEHEAQRKKDNKGKVKDEHRRLDGYHIAVRANRQLAIALQGQGINEDATRFAYRAQILQKTAFRLQMVQREATFKQRLQTLGAWLFSWFLFLIAGYGYKPSRSFLAYLLVISGFATVYYFLGHTVGPMLSPLGAFVFSMTSFHGRGFFPGNNISLDNPLTVLAALEALVGLIIEVTFIATLTQRFFNR